MAKFGTQKKVTVKGVEYTLQHPGVKKSIEIQDETIKSNGVPSITKMYELYMEHVIVEPKVNWEFFEENEGIQEVMQEAALFLNGEEK
ncbi:hypothetical protein P8917_00910 [Bacillus atrophaeus]|uniref:hypothetical protein n=1 Tax=Bacillus TaxID=1386 RepID=UPI001CA60409|nr:MULTISPECIES: hypothetical protein [Bacillus]MBY8913313.1 hypothetical protein [Bacillus sp. YC2]MCY7919560.1 hypothetical protein [Bacillus vallismortis]MCY8813679.1 hypothetical protein [Bacillus atrophaeus]MCY8820248.1 hypothetical protein [Bacillus atrophaeus]MCY8828628.1 hypothetical protein [Bacillus atrophaeus]